jgi:hypothetical protein
MAVICFSTIRGYLLDNLQLSALQVWNWCSGIELAAEIENS